MPSDDRIEAIQAQLSELLISGGTAEEQDKETGRQGDKESG